MSFPMFIPGWNSLDSVRRVHGDLELIALVFFALLVLFEVLAFLEKEHTKKILLEKIGLWFFAVAVLAELIAYPYGQRNDTLSGQEIGSLDIKAQRAADNASKAVADSSTAISQAKDAAGAAATAKKEADAVAKETARIRGTVEVVGKKAEQINQALGEAQYFLGSPELRDPEKLRKDLAPFKGKSAIFKSYKNDGDGYFVCKALLSVAQSAGMIPIDQCGEQDATPMVFKGVPGFLNSVFVSAPDDDTMEALAKVMRGATFMGATSAGFGNVPHPSLIVFFVGRKPHVIVSIPVASKPRKSGLKNKQ